MFQYIRTKRGSTLAMMLIIMAILTTLGVSILSATLMGHRFKVINNREKTAFYVAEAGLNEAYAYLGEEVENAIEYAQQIYIPGQMGAETTDTIGTETALRTPEQKQTLSEEDYLELKDLYFRQGYQWYFTQNSGVMVTNLRTKLLSTNGRIVGQNNVNIDSIDCELDTDSVTGNTFTSGKIQFNFKTNAKRIKLDGNETDASEQIICTLAVGIPNYNAPFVKQMTEFSVFRNALWDKALATDRNIYVLSDVTVNGNVFAYGNDLTGTPTQMKGLGGIIVGGVNDRTLSTPDTAVRGSLTVSGGSVVTDKYVMTLVSSSADPSSIDITGDLYCNSLVASSGLLPTPNTGSNIYVKGNVSILDDTELNSEDSHVKIEGSYFGFSSGSASDASHDSSSSLVINAEDISDPSGSSLEITGVGSKITDVPNTPVILNNGGIYLSGTVYVNDQTEYTGVTTQGVYGSVTINEDGKYLYVPGAVAPPSGTTEDTFTVSTSRKSETGTTFGSQVVPVKLDGGNTVKGVVSSSYQTGDSVSVVGNYLGYAQSLTSTADSRFSNLGPTYFTQYWPLDLVTHKRVGIDGKDKMSSLEKSEYSMIAKEEYPSLFDFGSGRIKLHGTTINNANVVFSLGTFINQTAANLGNMFNDKYVDFANANDSMRVIQKDYIFNTRWGGDVQEVDVHGVDFLSATMGYRPLRHWLKPEWTRTDGTVPTSKTNSGPDDRVYYASNMPGSDNEVLILTGADYDTDMYDTLVDRIINTEHKTPVQIDMPNGDIRPVQGIILGKNDLYVLGELEYSGLVMAQGDIWLIDDNPKTFSNTNLGQGGDLEGAVWEDANPVVDMVFDDIARNHSDFRLGDFFTQSSQDAAGAAWSRTITRNYPTSQPFAGGTNLSFAGSMNGVIQVTGWQRSNQRD